MSGWRAVEGVAKGEVWLLSRIESTGSRLWTLSCAHIGGQFWSLSSSGMVLAEFGAYLTPNEVRAAALETIKDFERLQRYRVMRSKCSRNAPQLQAVG